MDHYAAEVGMMLITSDCAGAAAANAVATTVITSAEAVGPQQSLEDLALFAAEIRNQYGPTTIVTCGERGCVVAPAGGAAGEAVRFPAYAAPAVVDTTGAGDLFRAGILYGQLQGWGLDEAVRFASAAGAARAASKRSAPSRRRQPW